MRVLKISAGGGARSGVACPAVAMFRAPDFVVVPVGGVDARAERLGLATRTSRS